MTTISVTGGSMKTVRATLDNGMTIEGTAEQIRQALEKIGFEGDSNWYFSKSRGLIRIRDMESTHLRNAILKMYQQWVESLHLISDPKEVVRRIVNGIQDPTWVTMVEELNNRRK